MAEAAPVQVECGFCLSKGYDMEESKLLSCSHIHCLGCLTGSYDFYGVIKCPYCKKVYDIVPNSLPSTDSETEGTINCDICEGKGSRNQSAVVYCTVCETKYCVKHQEYHDEIQSKHAKLSMDIYRLKIKKLEPGDCTEQKDYRYTMVCKRCHVLVCVQCVPSLDTCSDGSAHKLVSLDELVNELSKEVGELKQQVIQREDDLSSFFKQTSRIISDFDEETVVMVQTLRKTRDQQIKDIESKYKSVGDELLRLRGNTKDDITRFMEAYVGERLSALNRHREQLEARLRHSHHVDIVNRHEESLRRVKDLISCDLPTLELPRMTSLQVKDPKREIEVALNSTKSAVISLTEGLVTYDYLPSSMKLVKVVKTSSHCYSVDQHDSLGYVGLVNSVVSIDNNYTVTSFTATSNIVECVRVYQDRVYTLIYYGNFKHTINVHDLSGEQLTSWTHNDANSFLVKFVIHDGNIIIPNRKKKRLTIYSLEGQLIKQISCSQLPSNTMAMCGVDYRSVVLCDYESSRVVKVDTDSGDVTWTCSGVTKPLGVIKSHKSEHILVASGYSTTTTIYILDITTGQVLAIVRDSAEREKSYVTDLHVVGRTLVVTRTDAHELLYYKLE